MAKKKSVFDMLETTPKEIKKVAQKAQDNTIDRIPAREENNDKLMHLYVGESSHKAAKLSALKRDMKLGQYIEWLIEQDKAILSKK